MGYYETGRAYGSIEDLIEDATNDLYLEIAEYITGHQVCYPDTVGFYDSCIGNYGLSFGSLILTVGDVDDVVEGISLDEVARAVSYAVDLRVGDLVDDMRSEYDYGEMEGAAVDGVLYDKVMDRMRDTDEYYTGTSLLLEFVPSSSVMSTVANEIGIGQEVDAIRSEVEEALESDPGVGEGDYSILVSACNGNEYEWTFTVKRVYGGALQAFGEYEQNSLVDGMSMDCDACGILDCGHDEAIDALLPYWDGTFL